MRGLRRRVGAALVLPLGWLVACGSSGADGDAGDGAGDGRAEGHDGGTVPCDFDPHCGARCVEDDECGPVLYCGSDYRCRADCTAGGGECGSGWECEHGRCVEDCPSVVVDLTPVVPTVMLLIDQSGSMDEDFGGMTRWEAVEQALCDRTEGILPALESEVRFGATLYTSHGGSLRGEACPLLESIPPALDQADEIAGLLRDNGPDGDTPTGESIAAVVEALAGAPVPPDSPRIIVLATDGEPDTCAVPNPQEGQEESVAAAQAAFAAGVRILILSVGSDVGRDHLQDMANAGSGLPVGGPTDAPYYVANDPTELAAAFRTIIGGVRSCTLTLDGEVDPADRPRGDVRLDGAAVPYDEENGWTMPDGHTLELRGEACARYLGAGAPTLTAEWPCGTIIG